MQFGTDKVKIDFEKPRLVNVWSFFFFNNVLNYKVLYYILVTSDFYQLLYKKTKATLLT